jgi:hypothetical protein
MAASEARGRGGARGDSPIEHYVRQLLRDADRLRRSTQLRPRADAAVHVDRSLLRHPVRPSDDSATANLPPG